MWFKYKSDFKKMFIKNKLYCEATHYFTDKKLI